MTRKSWKTGTVGEVTQRVTKGTTPTTLGGRFESRGINFVKVESITEAGTLNHSKLAFIDEQTHAMLARSVLNQDDLLFSIAGTIGRVARVRPSDLPANTNQAVAIIRPDLAKVDRDYLYYCLRDTDRIARARTRVVQSVQQNLSLAEVSNIELPLPSLPEQRAIAATLGALDDKIESNRRAMALLSNLFSTQFSHLLESSRSISYQPLSEIATITRGRSYKSAELTESSVALVTLKSIDRNGGYKHDGLKPYIGPYKPEQVVAPGEIVVAQTDLTQGAEVVGRGVRVPSSEVHSALVASLDLAVLRPKNEMPNEYLLGLLSGESFRQHCRNHVTGTTVLHLAKDAMPTWTAPIVSTAEQESFSAVARELLARVDAFSAENQRLTDLRDALLPELLSGRIRAADVEITQ